MAITAVIGGQWGDEGKGKIVDLLCEGVEIVARYQGGANAGHTVQIGDDKFILHQVPSGILHDACTCILGHGMVIDPVAFTEELATLAGFGIRDGGRIKIAHSAHLVTPVHKAMDRATGSVIGTTMRGIGPAYADKARRLGIRAVELYDLPTVGKYIHDRLDISVQQGEIQSTERSDIHNEIEEFLISAAQLVPLLEDTIDLLLNAAEAGRKILIEGAQGAMLDIDLGTYPFVTSSHPTIGGVAAGLGLPPSRIDQLIGIFKAYVTRVGSGPFPTELFDDDGERLQNEGAEFGATTGRPRRCGWFDAVAARYSCRINGFTDVVITKLDILDHFDTIKVCTGYEINGERVESFSNANHRLEDARPIYEEHPGWDGTVAGIKSADELPDQARSYLKRLEELVGVRISQVSTGPERSQTFTL
ncbi:adenylosuccinate synthase [Candidatus Neomarinimicrobiota bacterium]